MPTEHFGQAERVVRQRYAADIDAYRAHYGKEMGERLFFAEHAPQVEASPPAPEPAPSDPFASVSIDVGLARR